MLFQNNIIFSPAKLNLGLKIPFRYTDGYHHLESVFIPLAWGDTLEFTETEDRHSLELVNEVPVAYQAGISQAFSAEAAATNLILRAIGFFEKNSASWGFSQPRQQYWKVKITKRIPSPCGLGGGSSNAAAVIKFLCAHSLGKSPTMVEKVFREKYLHRNSFPGARAIELISSQGGENPQLGTYFPTTPPWTDIVMQSSQLGSDIPFFLANASAYLSGRGSELSHIDIPPLQILVGIPPFGFSTAALYKSLQKPSKPPEYTDKIPLQADEFFGRVCIPGYFSEAENTLFLENDFWKPASQLYAAEMAEIEKVLTEMAVKTKSLVSDLVYAGLTGSGSAVYVAMCSQIPDQENLVHSLSAVYPAWHFVLTKSLNSPIGL
jgi:4-diphosphocytidyl-2-C-methyl-D-erythritol kinase